MLCWLVAACIGCATCRSTPIESTHSLLLLLLLQGVSMAQLGAILDAMKSVAQGDGGLQRPKAFMYTMLQALLT